MKKTSIHTGTSPTNEKPLMIEYNSGMPVKAAGFFEEKG
jgi:hypothetical protein